MRRKENYWNWKEFRSPETAGITEAIGNLDTDFNDFILNENQGVSQQTAPLRERLAELEKQRAALAGQLGDDAKAGIDLLKEQNLALERRITEIRKSADKQVAEYKDSLEAEGKQIENEKGGKLELLKTRKDDYQQEIEVLRNKISEEQNNLNASLEKLPPDG